MSERSAQPFTKWLTPPPTSSWMRLETGRTGHEPRLLSCTAARNSPLSNSCKAYTRFRISMEISHCLRRASKSLPPPASVGVVQHCNRGCNDDDRRQKSHSPPSRRVMAIVSMRDHVTWCPRKAFHAARASGPPGGLLAETCRLLSGHS